MLLHGIFTALDIKEAKPKTTKAKKSRNPQTLKAKSFIDVEAQELEAIEKGHVPYLYRLVENGPCSCCYLGVSINGGTPKWMVYERKSG